MRGKPDPRAFIALAGVVSAATVVGLLPAWARTPHHAALPPLGLFADIRVLLAQAPSYPVFVVGLGLVLALRTVFLAAATGSLDRDRFRWALRFELVALGPALVAGAFGFAATSALYAGFVWVAVAIAVITTLAMSSRPWRRNGESWHGPALLLVWFVLLLVVSLWSSVAGTPAQLMSIWIVAGLSYGAARLLGSTNGPTATTLLSATAAVAVVAVLALWLAAPPSAVDGSPEEDGSLFVVAGIGGGSGQSTMFGLDPGQLGFTCEQTWYFSYAGAGSGTPRGEARCPIRSGAPYEDVDTLRPLDELVEYFRSQLAELPAPVTVITHSQGGWVAAAALDQDTAARIDALVMLGAFPHHDRGYRVDGTGPGAVGTDAMEMIVGALRAIDATSFDPHAPLAREVLARPGAIDDILDNATARDLRVVTVTSAFDLPLVPPIDSAHGVVDLCPAYVRHGRLPTSSSVMTRIRGSLEASEESCAAWRRLPMHAFEPFTAPPA